MDLPHLLKLQVKMLNRYLHRILVKEIIFLKNRNLFFFSGGQPPLNLVNANYIFTQIAKLFCLMFHHEQTERSVQNESKEKKNFFSKEIFIFFKRRYYLEKIYGWLERSM